MLFHGTLSLNNMPCLNKVEQVAADDPDIVEQTGPNPDKIEQVVAGPGKD